jgi:hypothetical protein
MSRRQRRRAERNAFPSASRVDAPSAVQAPVGEASNISRLIEKGDLKLAVERAKALHKRSPSSETESLLAEAYLARVRSFGSGMGAEAFALLDLVANRCPSARARVEEARPLIAARTGMVDDLLRPLALPARNNDRIGAIEKAVRAELTDLGKLARTTVLPEGHPLRAAAAAVVEAFTAVTTRPVEDDEVALAEISHRSPLAPWKLLIRALACFYRADDEGCARYLKGIDPASAPWRLAASLKALMSAGGDGRSGAFLASLGPAGRALVARVGAGEDSFRRSLLDLDRALRQRKVGKVLALARAAIDQCRVSRPELVERLKQHVSIRCMLADVPVERVRSALGGPSRRNAYFFRLMAKAFETRHDIPAALAGWEDFRREAVAEGWFTGEGPEAAALYLHMVDVLMHVGEEEVRALGRSEPAAAANARGEAYFLFPERLFEKACACDPRSETFQRWLEWTQKDRDPKASENVALRWHAACPADPRPLLHLTEVTEKRNALKKALGFLEKAERLDGLNPEVKRARLRLVVATAIRHLKERKLHLAEQDLAELTALPQAQQGRRRALVPALRAVFASLRSEAETFAWIAEVAAELESQLGAAVFIQGIARACDVQPKGGSLSLLQDAPLQAPGTLAVAVARACALGNDLGLPLLIPREWEERLAQDLRAGGETLGDFELRALAEQALRQGAQELAYFASGIGLTHPALTLPRFLLLRAQSLPYWEEGRRRRCLVAAGALARRQRDMELLGRIVEVGRRMEGPFFDVNPGVEEREPIEEVLRDEKAAGEYPAYRAPSTVRTPVCAACGRRHGQPGGDPRQYDLFPGEDDFEEDFEEELDEDNQVFDVDEVDSPDVSDLPQTVIPVLMEILEKHGDREGELPLPQVLERKDPKLFARLRRELEKAGLIPTEAIDDWPFGPPRKRRKKGR